MATTVTSTLRGTPALAVAPTQNTAPVHEFRCLYTRDLHKKAKKWHDGFLRFHTFNRRVMVYDDAKNYIGDLHYTQEEEFVEGVEIRLDRGVNVEVGERLGETETDLAPILERQRPEKPGPQHRQTTHPATRPNSSGFSQRPKSLLEVLGPSQGRLGRSRLSLQSPYELRQPTHRVEPAQPLAKKRRLSREKENQSVSDIQQATRSNQPISTHAVRLTKTTTLVGRREETPIVFEDVLDLSSDDDRRRPRNGNTGRQRMQTEAPKQQSKEKVKPLSESLKPRRAVREQKVEPPRRTKPSRAISTKLKNASEAQKGRTSTTATSSRSSVQRIARLLLSQPKPRTKLTCLLPFVRDSSEKGTVNASNAESQCRIDVVGPMRSHRSESSMQDQEPTHGNNNGHHSPTQISDSRTSTPEAPQQSIHEISSPLFVPEDNAGHRSPSPRPLPTQEDFPFLDLSGNAASSRAEQLHPPHGNIDAPDTDLDGIPGQDAVASPLRTNTHESVHQEGVGGDPDLSFPLQDAASRTFRRVFSENDAMDDEELGQLPALHAHGTRSPLKLLDDRNSRRVPRKAKSPTKVHRWASDTVALDKQLDNEADQDMEELPKGETGPWTAEEAFLLFDWWPPEKQKPEFWDALVNKPSVRAAVPGPGQGGRTGITTARQFLRDDINVL
ncbi:hypothetical protein A1O1_08521 [Capronia coronata CBS 617.96]|uniref:5'-3' DNA helicase ZGRF1-like N-terminal domain-containing protein n=1 Tax=Capronia coronata CBS 617.96 TaxID=1182541 RepID=W9XIR2_9EURO|nr:uncharacterized protein A1O1_08521 [Capronia coronata CBS 617.96]EXJ80377.1 hypothetical protein A1O1_08521 [Capronia coronata CBS 617.96]